MILVVLFAISANAAQTVQTGDVAVQQQGDHVRFTLITAGGYAGFVAAADWQVIAMQSRPPVTVSAFYVPDPADNGTRDSTNLAISLFTPGVPKADDAIAAIGMARGSGPVTIESRGEWSIYRQDAYQGGTLYTILDAKSRTADVICGVRLAWPHLKGHRSDHDARMNALFDATLASISGSVGTYELHLGEIVRRPDPQ
jgi:hypothetical protein